MILKTIEEFRPQWTSQLTEGKEILLYYGEFGARPNYSSFSSDVLGVHLKLPEHRSRDSAHEASFQLLCETAGQLKLEKASYGVYISDMI
jgi:hypothetical protein